MKDVGGAGFAGSSPPFLGRERAAVDVDVGPERRSPRYHETLRPVLLLRVYVHFRETARAISENAYPRVKTHTLEVLVFSVFAGKI